jgi:hypothetical protein
VAFILRAPTQRAQVEAIEFARCKRQVRIDRDVLPEDPALAVTLLARVEHATDEDRMRVAIADGARSAGR